MNSSIALKVVVIKTGKLERKFLILTLEVYSGTILIKSVRGNSLVASMCLQCDRITLQFQTVIQTVPHRFKGIKLTTT